MIYAKNYSVFFSFLWCDLGAKFMICFLNSSNDESRVIGLIETNQTNAGIIFLGFLALAFFIDLMERK